MLKDVRYAIRMLLKNPGFTLVAVLSLAIGTGANSAMFSLADAMLLRPLPVLRPSEVLTLQSQTPKAAFSGMSYPDYRDLRDHSKTINGMVAYTLFPVGYAPTKEALPKVKYGLLISGNVFTAMGVPPELGRGFHPEEDKVQGRDAVVVLGHDFWMSEFGGDPSIVERTVRLNSVDFKVIGVAPESFSGLDQYFKVAMFIPAMMYPRLAPDPKNNILEKRDDHGFSVKARLAPGFSQAQAESELKGIAAGLAQSFPATNQDRTIALRTELQARVEQSPPDAAMIAMLMMLAAAVLIVSCINVANLLLSRAQARSREIAVRLAIGAGRVRLVRQLLTESLLLSLAGAASGLLFAYVGVLFFREFRLPSDMPFQLHIALNYRALAFTLITCFVAVLIFGLVPAIRGTRLDLVTGLKSTASDSGKKRLWGRNTLVVAQVAISLVLLVISVSLYRGFNRLLNAGVGYRTDHLLMMSFDPTLVRYSDTQAHEFFRHVVERAAAAPGVKSAALTRAIPMAPMQSIQNFIPEGYQLPKDKQAVFAFSNVVDEHYFDTIGVKIVSGRGFRVTDNADAPQVVVVNQAIAKKYWPNADAVGKRIRLDDANGTWAQVVGVAVTAKCLWIAEPPMDFLYLPYAQHLQSRMTLIAQTDGPSASVAAPLREIVHSLDPNLPVYDVRTMEEFFEVRAVGTSNMILNTIGAMGLMGLVLAMVGLYGLVAYSVSQRTREFGIRMAIGASTSSVLRMVLSQGMVLAGVGIVLGAALGVAADRGMRAIFYSAQTDWMTFVIVPLMLVTMTALAAFAPARRASRIDPMMALRDE